MSGFGGAKFAVFGGGPGTISGTDEVGRRRWNPASLIAVGNVYFAQVVSG